MHQGYDAPSVHSMHSATPSGACHTSAAPPDVGTATLRLLHYMQGTDQLSKFVSFAANPRPSLVALSETTFTIASLCPEQNLPVPSSF